MNVISFENLNTGHPDEELPKEIKPEVRKFDKSVNDVQSRMCGCHGDFDTQVTCSHFIQSSYHQRCTFTNEYNPMCTYSEVMYENMVNFKPFRCK